MRASYPPLRIGQGHFGFGFSAHEKESLFEAPTNPIQGPASWSSAPGLVSMSLIKEISMHTIALYFALRRAHPYWTPSFCWRSAVRYPDLAARFAC